MMRALLMLPFLLGLVATVAIQRRTPTGWWLNSAEGVLMTMGMLFVLGVIVGMWRRLDWQPPAALVTGSFVGSAIVLFRIGPGNIFPIVLAFCAGMAAVAVFVGVGVGFVVSWPVRWLVARK